MRRMKNEKSDSLYEEGKKFAHDLYEESKHTVVDIGDRFVHNVQERPVASALFISGLSLMIIAAFLRR